MSKISGVFKYYGDVGFKEIQGAMQFLGYCAKLKAAGAKKSPHAYCNLTSQRGSTESFPGVISKDMWRVYTPTKLEAVFVDDSTRDRKDMGRVVVYDATGAEQPFEMEEAFYKAISKRLDTPKFNYFPTDGIKFILG